ncbi:MAG: class I SAM-dependent methyltransferase [Dehalococcoidia bacterium]
MASDEALMKLLEPCTSARLLDCGCGDGSLTARVARKVGTEDVWGLEIGGESSQKARVHGVKVVRAELNRGLPFVDETFDAVLTSRTFSCLWNIDHFLREVRRILRVGGYFAILNANLASLHNVLYLLLGLQPLGAPASNEGPVGTWDPFGTTVVSPWSNKAPTMTGLRALLTRHRFLVEGVKGVGYYPLPGVLARTAATLDKRHASWIALKGRRLPDGGGRDE